MKFTRTQIIGVYLIDLEPIKDERGFFARSFCTDEFQQQEMATNFVQCNVSFTECKGTIRGMHYQIFPDTETKLVRCTKGAM